MGLKSYLLTHPLLQIASSSCPLNPHPRLINSLTKVLLTNWKGHLTIFKKKWVYTCNFQSNIATVAKTRGFWNLPVNLIVVIQFIVLFVLLPLGDLKIEWKGTCMREMVSCVHKQIITMPSCLWLHFSSDPKHIENHLLSRLYVDW